MQHPNPGNNSDAAAHLNLWFAQGSHNARDHQQQPQSHPQPQGIPQDLGGASTGASPYPAHAQLPYGQPMHHHGPPPPHHGIPQQHAPQDYYASNLAQFPGVDPHTGSYHNPYSHHQPQQHYPDMQHYGQMDPSLHYGAGGADLFQQHHQQPDPSLGFAADQDQQQAPKTKKGKKKTGKRNDPYGEGSEPVVVNNDGSIPLSRAAFRTVCKYCCMKKDENPDYQIGIFHKGKCTNPIDPEHGSRWLSLRCKSCSKDVCTSSEIYKRHQCPPGYPSPMPGKSYRTHRRKKDEEGDIDDIDQYWTDPNVNQTSDPNAGANMQGHPANALMEQAQIRNDEYHDPSSAYGNSLDVLSQLAGAQ